MLSPLDPGKVTVPVGNAQHSPIVKKGVAKNSGGGSSGGGAGNAAMNSTMYRGGEH